MGVAFRSLGLRSGDHSRRNVIWEHPWLVLQIGSAPCRPQSFGTVVWYSKHVQPPVWAPHIDCSCLRFTDAIFSLAGNRRYSAAFPRSTSQLTELNK